jgi:hypothetical protein
MTKLAVAFRNFVNAPKKPIGISDNLAEIWTPDLSNKEDEHKPLDHDSRPPFH